jgi:hypothetical protein
MRKIKMAELTQEEQIEYDVLVDEFVAKGGPTIGQIKKCGKKSPEKVARLIELGWIVPCPGDNENEVTETEINEDVTHIPIMRDDASELVLPIDLYNRARKIGLADDQLKGYPDEVAVKAACDRMSPGSNPDGKVKAVVLPKVEPTVGEGMPDKFEFESKMETEFVMGSRSQFDENNLRAELRRINRKYGPQKPVRIDSSRSFKAVKGKNAEHRNCKFLVTTYEIFMK